MNENDFEDFLKAQKQSASPRRLEMLEKDLSGTKKMLECVLLPVFGSFEGMVMEYEFISTSGVRAYVDIFYKPLEISFESEGFVSHAESITRDRFSFEKTKVRTSSIYGYKYMPFSWDQLDKKSEFCRRDIYELLGRLGSNGGLEIEELSVNEREFIRYALRLNRPFRLADVCNCLQLKSEASRAVLRKLLEKKLIRPVKPNKLRVYAYVLEDKARKLRL